ncbi:MAG: hypothetical protein BroJett011_44250 [Chloroflexota bacterium]|nr:MAG: hypothetical protein BroJett011_44250 [Chloroflexota bacterium]
MVPPKVFALTKIKSFLPVLITLILTAYQLWRIIAFVNVYGGFEHDGGWTLGAARSLVERGEYTYMVSVIADPSVPAAINVDKKFDIQAPDGRIWFRTSASIGPASVVPEAIVLKIFGFSFWALRVGPLLFYTLFLLLAAYTVYQLAGLGAVVLFHAFLFFYPHLSIFLSYEALGEVPSMVYQLCAFLAFATVLKKQDHRWLHFLGVGLIAGLAANAKLLTLLSISGIFAWAGYLWLFERKRVRFGELLSLGGGVALVGIGWELVQLIVLTWLTNFEVYLQHGQQRWFGFLDEGSGLRLRTESGPEFMWRKFLVLKEITHSQPEIIVLVVVGIFLGGLALLGLWREREKRNLLVPIWLGWLAHTAWFVSLAKTGWARHYWFGLILAVILLCIIPLTLLRADGLTVSLRFGRTARLVSLGVGLLLLALIGWGFACQPYVRSFFLPDEIVAYWQQKRVNNNYQATLPSLIVPRSAQTAVVEHIKKMPPEANVYYPFAHKAAELPVQTGRINYPLDRRGRADLAPHPADILVFQPFLVSAWTHDPTMRQDLLGQIEQVCPHPIIKNDYYIVCLVEELRPRP